MKTCPIQPAQITRDALGIPFSPHFGDRYHAQIGPAQQAQHVFIQGHGLPQRWQGRDRFVVLETGFGLGYNFLATWAAWRSDEKRCHVLEFLSLEAHPLTLADLQALHQNSPWPDLSHELIQAWPPLTPNWHALHFDGGRVRLLLALGDVATCLPHIRACVDAFDLDGFAPRLNPEMWQARLFKQMARLAAPGATVATWSCAGIVRSGLRSAGFDVHKAPGAGGKRHITLARYAPTFVPRRSAATAQQRASSVLLPHQSQGHAIIVGAGLAGCSAAWALAQHGWHSEVWDQHRNCAQEASGNWAGLFHGVVHAQDNMHARALRAAALQAALVLKQALNDGVSGDMKGLLRLISPKDAKTVHMWRDCLSAQGLPAAFAQVLDAAQASALASFPIAHPAWFFPGGGWIDPAGLARWFLQTAGAHTQFKGETAVKRLEKTPRGWALLNEQDQLLGESSCVILANAADAARLWLSSSDQADAAAWVAQAWPMERVRGQISRCAVQHLPSPMGSHPLAVPIAGAGYVIPWRRAHHADEDQAAWVFGATSQIEDLDPQVRPNDHASNWANLLALLGLDAFDASLPMGLEPVHDLGARSVSSGWDEMQGANRSHSLGYDEDLQRSRSPQAGDNRPANEIVNRLMRERRAAPKFSHPPRGAWRIATGLGALLEGRTQWRAVSRDRLPLIGAVPQMPAPTTNLTTKPSGKHTQRWDQPRYVSREPGLFVYTALGSRGITWAALGAQMLAAWVCGSPAPVEADMWDALDPARFLVRAVRAHRG